jgi:hypothetical protein
LQRVRVRVRVRVRHFVSILEERERLDLVFHGARSKCCAQNPVEKNPGYEIYHII